MMKRYFLLLICIGGIGSIYAQIVDSKLTVIQDSICLLEENARFQIDTSGTGLDITSAKLRLAAQVEGNDSTIESEININGLQFNLPNLLQKPGAFNYFLIVNDTTYSDTIIVYTSELSIQLRELNSISCSGVGDASLVVDASGALGRLQYTWGDGQDTDTITQVAAGEYQVTVTDQVCIDSDTIQVNNPDELQLSIIEVIQPSCKGNSNGQFTYQVRGGTEPITYLLNGETLNPTNRTIMDLEEGLYTLTAIDQNQCQKDTTFSLSVPTGLDIRAEIDDPSCPGSSDGAIRISIEGAEGVVIYQWEDIGAVGDSIRTGLMAGTYTLMVLDDKMCPTTREFTLDEQAGLTVSIDGQLTICEGESTQLMVSILGDEPVDTFEWSTGETSSTISVTDAGEYSVSVTENGCTYAATVSVLVNPIPNVSLGNDTVLCATTGIRLNAGGPFADYQWSQNGNSIINDTSILVTGSPGLYCVTVTNENNCSSSSEVQIDVASPFSVTQSISNTDCNGAANGSINLDVEGSVGPYSYQWSDIQILNVPNRIGLSPGNYSITITDSIGCTESETFQITQPDGIQLQGENTACEGEVVELKAEGEDGTYFWSSGENTALINVDTSGVYKLVAQVGSCTYEDSIQVTFFELPDVQLINDTTICQGNNIQLLEAVSPGSYVWSRDSIILSESTSSFLASVSGNYKLSVTDNNECSRSDEVKLIVAEPPSISLKRGLIYCEGEEVILDDIIETSEGKPNSEVSWLSEALGVISDQSSYTVPVDSFSDILRITLRDTAECFSNPAIDSTSIQINPRPNPIIRDGLQEVCENQTNVLYLSANLSEGSEVTWRISDVQADILYQNRDSLLVHWTNGGDGEINIEEIITETGCKNAQTVPIRIDPDNRAPERVEVVKKTGGVNILISLDDASDCYQWGYTDLTTGEETLVGNNEQFFVAGPDLDNLNREYWLETFNSSGGMCDFSQGCRTRNIYIRDKNFVTQIEKWEELDFSWSVFPNPAQNSRMLSMLLESRSSKTLSLSIINVTGQALLQQKLYINQGEHKHFLEGSENLDKGVYFIRLLDEGNGNSSIQKIIIQ